MLQFSADQLLDIAQGHHQNGRLGEAEAVYRQILQQQPQHAPTLHSLGILYGQTGHIDAAAELFQRAVAAAPANPDYHYSLGFAHLNAGRIDAALTAFQEALRLNPTFAESYFGVGNCRRARGELEAAIESYRQCLKLESRHADAWNNLGVTLQAAGRFDEAIDCFGKAAELRPDFAAAHYNLGNAAVNSGRLAEAIAAYRRALQLQPGFAEALGNLGTALWAHGAKSEAIETLRRAVQLRPESAQAHYSLGNILHRHGQIAAALESLGKAVQLNPQFAEAHYDLGNTLKDNGQVDEAIASLRRAMELAPENAPYHSDLIYTLHFQPEISARAIHDETLRWDALHAGPLREFITAHPNERDPERRLRIGYVSPDFCLHAVAMCLLPLLTAHDHEHFEVFCYSRTEARDFVTERCRGYADAWRDVLKVSPQEAADIIRRDRIDILVDLALHTGGGGRGGLLIFARKPAPVQVTFAGYPGSTGLAAMDYRLTDAHLDPSGEHDDWYSEKSIRLPGSFWCYEPLGESPDISALPALTAGRITFGCLSNFCKINEGVIERWSRVLRAVAGSRMVLLAPEGAARARVLGHFARQGIEADRILFEGRKSRGEYLRLYQRIDIGLDTLPYNGHMTSLDSFWMGVPVVTLAGETAAGRAGYAQAMTLGLGELAAETADDFVRIAAELAVDLPRLAELRAGLRHRMQTSVFMDYNTFARGIEAAYRDMWRTWCASAR